MKTVFTNYMVAHVWAQQSQEAGRSGNGNFSFLGARLYSYNTVIANFVTDTSGNKVPLFTTRTYSITTSCHMSKGRRAVNYAGYTVPSIGYRWENPDHAINLAYLETIYRSEIATMRRCRDMWGNAQERLQRLATTAESYAAAFGVELSAILDPVGDAAEVLRFRAEREARLNTPEAIAKRKRERERRHAKDVADFRECKGKWPVNARISYKDRDRFSYDDAAARNARLAIINADKIGAWRRGEIVDNYGMRYDGHVLLRVRGDNIQTSRGATFPVEHGRRAFPLIKACRDNKREFAPNGHTIHLGHFTVAKIDASGNVTAGCHFVRWEEIEQVAKQLGIADDPGNVVTICA